MPTLCGGVCYPIHKTLLDDIINGAMNIQGFSNNSTVLNFVLMWDVSNLSLTPATVSLTNTYEPGKFNIFVILNLISESGEHAQCLHLIKRMEEGEDNYDCYRIEPHSKACETNFETVFKLENLDTWLENSNNLNRLMDYPRIKVSYKGARYLGVQELTNSNDEFPLGMCLSWILYYLAMIAQQTNLFIHDDKSSVSPVPLFKESVAPMSDEELVNELKRFTSDTKKLADEHAISLKTSRVYFTELFQNPVPMILRPVVRERGSHRFNPIGKKSKNHGGGDHVKKSKSKKKPKSKRKSKFIKKSKRLTKRRKNLKRKTKSKSRRRR